MVRRKLPWCIGFLLLLALAPAGVRASVTLVSFEALPEETLVRVTWETASEVDLVGFYVQRAPTENGTYTRISPIIPATGGMMGALYEHVDADVSPGDTLYYRLETLEVTGYSELFGPISATLPVAATSTPQPSPIPATSTPQPTATPRPLLVHFWVARDRLPTGTCTTLHWQVENAHAVYYQEQPATGNEVRQVCPPSTTTYTLRVVGDAGEETHRVTVNVDAAGATASPTVRPSATPQPTASPTSGPASTATPPGTPAIQLPTVRPTVTPSPERPPALTATPLPTPTPTPILAGSLPPAALAWGTPSSNPPSPSPLSEPSSSSPREVEAARPPWALIAVAGAGATALALVAGLVLVWAWKRRA
jgi:hypothetical protein